MVFSDKIVTLTLSTRKSFTVDITVKSPFIPDSIIIYRSFYNFSHLPSIDIYKYPISKIKYITHSTDFSYSDSLLAYNCTYYYYAKVFSDNSTAASSVTYINIPFISFIDNPGKSTSVFINKKYYYLELLTDDKTVVRVPVNFGGNPVDRKLYEDKLSTPEGIYTVSYFNPKSTYYKSIGVSYPNSDDKKRYQDALINKLIPSRSGRHAGIGGLIAIHGGGIGSNWTWGCIALQNSDIDFLYSFLQKAKNVTIGIAGSEVSIEECLTKLKKE
jgi:murein L,D-transpeptidase YafK